MTRLGRVAVVANSSGPKNRGAGLRYVLAAVPKSYSGFQLLMLSPQLANALWVTVIGGALAILPAGCARISGNVPFAQ